MVEKISQVTTDLSGLISILADNLYSTPDVVIRELVQNSHDAIFRRRLEDPERDFAARIDIQVNVSDRSFDITDNGSGLTLEEIETCLATIATGYTQKLRQESGRDELIGFFGLGFLSAYVVSEKVEVFTCSYQTPDQAWHFTSRDAKTYSIVEAEPRPVGTTVRLHLSEDFAHLTDFYEITAILRHYCALLSVPIHVNEAPEPINCVERPWLTPDLHPIQLQKQLMEFCKTFSKGFEPIYAIPIPEGRSVTGVLWIHDFGTYGTSDNRNISVYLRGMLLSENDRHLLPAWAGFVSAIIDSVDLTPTASRESLKKDDLYYRVQDDIHAALLEGLLQLSNEKPDVWRQIARRHNEALRGAALADEELFDALADKITLPTNRGDRTVSEICADSKGKIYISMGDEGSAEEVLFQSLDIPVVRGYRYAVVRFCSEYAARHSLTVVTLGQADSESAIFSVKDGAPEGEDLVDLLVDPEREQPVLAAFDPPFMPIVKIPDRKAILKAEIEADEADQRLSSAVLSLARSTVEKIEDTKSVRVYINLQSPLLEKLRAMPRDLQVKYAAMIRAFFDIPIAGEQIPLSSNKSPYESFFTNLQELMER